MKQINTIELSNRLNESPTLKVVDVRESYEVAQGKVPGAIHIALGQLTSKVDELDKNTTYAVICQSGYRSLMACQFLEQHGYSVLNVMGGMSAWQGKME